MRSSPVTLGLCPRRALWVAAATLMATGCRAPEGTPDSPVDTAARPFVKDTPLTTAESERNDRFQDLRRTRFDASEPLEGTPVPASAERE